jgi:S1-C subfamily serine protease
MAWGVAENLRREIQASGMASRRLPRLSDHGRIARGYIGLGLQPVAIEGGDASGAMVMSVDPQGPGAARVSTRGTSSSPCLRSGNPITYCRIP